MCMCKNKNCKNDPEVYLECQSETIEELDALKKFARELIALLDLQYQDDFDHKAYDKIEEIKKFLNREK